MEGEKQIDILTIFAEELSLELVREVWLCGTKLIIDAWLSC